ncbi:MAG: sodium:alanine symporter family protein [Gammaproteobacteria bacterium]|jgi:AGCS family alanine or glycine:cation symporter|nr:sodium:alanine symporter family protein [Gammaproteobacteria bacterium]
MLDEIKNILSLYVLIPLVGVVGLALSIRFGFVQCTHMTKAWKFFIGDRDPSGKRSSSFSAVSAVLGGNLGTGNISGIAVALTMGGPGALFWMWVMATLGAILKFVGCALGVLYRQKDEKGEYIGGPMYYLAKGLGLKGTAKIYCVLAILAALTVGNLVQMNSLALPFTQAGVPPLATGLVMSLIVAAVILGGLHRFSAVASFVVPFMAVGYIGSCLLIVLFNLDKLFPAIDLIFHAAFSPMALGGGVAGFTVLQGMKVGFDRGLFATDVGVGIDSIIHSSVESKSSLTETALTQGLISTLSPLIVMLVCTLTGLVLIMTDTWIGTGLESTNLCIEAFRRGFATHFAGHIITVTLFFFAFTTILTWSFCADKAIEFLFSRKMIRPFQYLFVAVIPLGAIFHVKVVWTVADIFMNLMLVINVIGLIGLYRHVTLLYSNPERKRVYLQSN